MKRRRLSLGSEVFGSVDTVPDIRAPPVGLRRIDRSIPSVVRLPPPIVRPSIPNARQPRDSTTIPEELSEEDDEVPTEEMDVDGDTEPVPAPIYTSEPSLPHLSLDHNDFDNYRLKSGVDSINIMSTDFDSFCDTIAKRHSIWKFHSPLLRTSVDTGSRYKVRYDEELETPELVGGAKARDIPIHLFPNVRLADLSIAVGVTMSISIYLIRPKMIQKKHFLSRLQMTVLCAAFNFARKKVSGLRDFEDLILEGDWLDIIRRFQPLQKFSGQIGSKTDDEYLKWTNNQIPSGYGRLFLRAVFSSLKLFFTDFEAAKRSLKSTGDDIYSYHFHGVFNSLPTKEEYIDTARQIYDTSIIFGKCVGCKNAFEGNPEVNIPMDDDANAKKQAANKFMRVAFDIHKLQISNYFSHSEELDEDGDFQRTHLRNIEKNS
jgi:hypothetical protein